MSLVALASPSRAYAACTGQDLLARMARDAPADYAAIEESGRAMPYGEGRLFRVTRAGLAPSFLFGTLHVVDPRLATLSAVERDAVRSAKLVALETLDFEGRSTLSAPMSPLAARGGDRASRLLSQEDFRRLQRLTAERGVPTALADAIKAPALALMLDLPVCAKRNRTGPSFLDAQVLAAAHAAAIPAIGLESLAEQVRIADGLSPAQQTALLSAVLAQAPEADSVIETTVSLYRAGKAGVLLAWTRAPRPIVGVEAAGVPPAFLDRIVTARTGRMRDRLLPRLAGGGVFVAVGITHIPGTDGLAALLVAAGYGIETME